MSEKTLADFVLEQVKELNGMVYSNRPYSCAIDEALGFFRKYSCPKEGEYRIEKEEKSVTIYLKPVKGSGKRKWYQIILWVS